MARSRSAHTLPEGSCLAHTLPEGSCLAFTLPEGSCLAFDPPGGRVKRLLSSPLFPLCIDVLHA